MELLPASFEHSERIIRASFLLSVLLKTIATSQFVHGNFVSYYKKDGNYHMR